MTKKSPLAIGLGLVWAAAFVAGLNGLVQQVTRGHEMANYGSYVPWGLWVAQYTYFVGLSAGAFVVAALVYVFRVRALAPVARLALVSALITMGCALFAIWLDLGQPLRFWKLYTSPQPTSVMSWMVWIYTAYVAVVLAMLWFALRAELVLRKGQSGAIGSVARFFSFGSADTSPASLARDRGRLRALGIVGLALAVVFPGGSGALFGVLSARPYWNSSLFPVLFIVSALASGMALLTFVAAYFLPEQKSQQYRQTVETLARTALGLILLDVLIEFAEFSIGLYAAVPAQAEAARAVLFGPYWPVFWIGHVALGVVLPVLVLATTRSPKLLGAAGFLAAAMFLAVRLNLVIPGQVIPELAGLERAFTDQHLTFAYFPSVNEFLVSTFVVALGVGVFFLASWLLPLTGSGLGALPAPPAPQPTTNGQTQETTSPTPVGV